jgi:uncharacterized protein (DUF427 family)
VYYFPIGDVRTDSLVESGTARSPGRGTTTRYSVEVAEASAPDAAYRYQDSPIEELRNHIAFEWEAMEHWFEEDEEVFVHARDPYTRVDILPSSRSVRVEIGGAVVAESDRPTLVFETGLPVRYYLPRTDVDADVLRPSDTITHCPYKGTASHHSVEVSGVLHEDVLWTYPFPARESVPLAGLLGVYHERADLYVDGVLQARTTGALRDREPPGSGPAQLRD